MSPMVDIDAVLSRMTLDEKLAQLGCVWCTALVEDDEFSPAAPTGCSRTASARSRASARPPACGRASAPRSRTRSSATSSSTPGSASRRSCTRRAPPGLCARDATQFPQAIGLASTWDPDLVERIGVVIREQMVATGARHTLAPVLDVARDPRWGRVEETYGESAYLAGRLGVAYVRGVQGDLATGVAATGKHFLGYALSEGGLNHAPVQLGPRELREVVAEPFRAAIAEAGLATVMNSYASVDGLPCGGSKAILDDLLRGELGFTGAVVADYSTTELLMSHHRIAATKGEAARRALEAGLDMELPATRLLRRAAARARRGRRGRRRARRPVGPPRARAQGRARPVRRSRSSTKTRPTRAYARPADRALAREAAVKSLVLLRNEGDLLPLSPDQRIAVIGPRPTTSDCSRATTPTPRTPRSCSRATADGRLIEPAGDFAPGPYYPESVTPLAGIRAIAGARHLRQGRGRARHGHRRLRRGGRGRARGRRRDLLRRRALGPHARLHERRVPRRQRPRPARRAAAARRGRGRRPARRRSWSW